MTVSLTQYSTEWVKYHISTKRLAHLEQLVQFLFEFHGAVVQPSEKEVDERSEMSKPNSPDQPFC